MEIKRKMPIEKKSRVIMNTRSFPDPSIQIRRAPSPGGEWGGAVQPVWGAGQETPGFGEPLHRWYREEAGGPGVSILSDFSG